MNVMTTLVAQKRIIGAFAFALGFTAFGARAATPLTDISPTPLYRSQTPHPNVVVSMSVEFPSVGAAFEGVSYSGAKEYVGYFEPGKCYTYVSGSPGYYAASGPVLANHECADKFSGNFMNWLTMSAIDEFRYAMTGGNREVDYPGASGAILQRAVLPGFFYDGGGRFSMRALSSSFLATVVPASVAGPSGLTVYAHNCAAKLFFGVGGTGAAWTCASPDASNGAFDVRIAVCGPTDLPVRTDLCKNYGTAEAPIYKPVGQAQWHADEVRLAVFGYLADDSQSRYGGVLRAPMGYVGPNTYDANLTPTVNTRSEINPDGTLVADPQGTAASEGFRYSGFINYINKFGSAGSYKQFDPMGEMYYEALRYYQNLGPTPDATAGMTPAMKDSFPVATPTQWVDPILARCAKNYIINLSDANTWNDMYVPGYNNVPPAVAGRATSRAVTGGLDAVAWTKKIGDLEADPATTTMPGGVTGLSGLESRYYANYATYFAAGMAYWANTTDIRPSLPGNQTVQTISVDFNEYGAQSVDPSRQLYLMGKYGGFRNTKDRASDSTPNPFWSENPADPNGPAIRSNSEWESPPGSLVPAGYLLSSSPDRLITGLRSAFDAIVESIGTIGGAALTSTNLTVSGAGAYIAKFTPNRWSGTVERHGVSINPSFEAVVSVPPSPTSWNAGAMLDARCGTVAAASTTCLDSNISPDRRAIYTAISSGVAGGRAGAEFTWASVSVDSSYAAALNTPDPAAPLTVDTRGQQRLNYLRGYRADEATATAPSAFRTRDSALGDIINSAPVYVGAPSTNIPDQDYQAFYASHLNRRTAVYVGANDGMLHAFDGAPSAIGGSELFAYVPGFSKTDLSSLANPSYVHKTFVDTTPKVQEVKLGSSPGVWKTVLVGANGNGAQGVFALDVTDPDPVAFNTSKVLFEFSDADDPDLGSVMSAPEIAKLQVGVDATGKPMYQYFAVVTSYNQSRTTVNGRADANVSVNGSKGFLFLLSLEHPIGTPWGTPNVVGAQYFKYAFEAPDPTKPMGLGPVTLLPSKTGDHSTAALYFGDLQGDLWRFNTAMTAAPYTTANWWKSALSSGTGPIPIFHATNGTNPQPITQRPEVANGPFGSTLLFFGTGKYLGDSDQRPAATAPYYPQQSQYTVLDTNPSTDRTLTRADLEPRIATPSVSGASVTVSGSAFTYSGASAKHGWYLDFPNSVNSGERSINKPAVRAGLLTFDTLTLAGDICGSGGFVYQLDALTGTQLSGVEAGYVSTVGIPGPPQIVDLQSILGVDRATGEQINQRKQTTLVAGARGTIDTTRDSNGTAVAVTGKVPPIGRVSWREITNWNDKTRH